jgi:hypothetical protein
MDGSMPGMPGTRSATADWLEIDAAEFRRCFDRVPFLVRHRLSGHPLFALPRLLELAATLPAANVEYNAGNIPVSLAPDLTPRNGLSAAETIRRIEDCNSWLVLKYVESDPAYRALLEACLAQIARHSEPLRPGMCMPQGFIFLSSPGSVTPYHMDPEHNFLLQIRGAKSVRLYDAADRALVSHEELERFHAGAHRNLRWRPECETSGQDYSLEAGQGLHFPVCAPHFVRNGGSVSISFSITFRTPDKERDSLVHRFNGVMRSRGLRPSPIGRHPWTDALKSLAFRAGARLHRQWPRSG